MDLYQILEVDPDATQSEIRKSYHKLAIKYHPDKNKDTEEKFKTINFAYSILSDPDKRRIYDINGQIEHSAEIIESYDFTIDVTYEELINGGHRTLKISEEEVCLLCRGYSQTFGIKCQCSTAPKKSSIIEVVIEPKSWPKRIIKSGNRYIMLKPRRDPKKRLRHRGSVLIYTYPITVYHALIGLIKDIKILDLTHRIDHPQPILPDTYLVIEDAGLYHPTGRGQLVIEFDILYPDKVSDIQRGYLEKIIEDH